MMQLYQREYENVEITEVRESCPYSLMWVQPAIVQQVGGWWGGLECCVSVKPAVL